jgi:uncharacterized membrane protein YeaQ/YmgE (transglycosylase-associated protein family)
VIVLEYINQLRARGMFGGHGVTGVNLYSLFVAGIGAVIVLVLYHAVRGGRARA